MMFKNYFNTSIRSLLKNKFYTALNILGLSAGVTCFLLIALFIFDELSYDKHVSDAEHIYRLDFKGVIQGSEFNTCLASVPAAEALMNDYPEVKSAVRLRTIGDYLINRKGKLETFKEEAIVYADSNFFTFFKLPILQGDANAALKGPNKVAISRASANRIFKKENPIGQTLVIDGDRNFEVSAVFEDIPKNSHFQFDYIFSMASRDEAKQKVWMSFNFHTYIQLNETADYKALEAKFPDMIAKYIGPEVRQFMGQDLKSFYEAGNQMGYTLFPLLDIHLYSDKLGEIQPNGDIQYVYLFSAVAFFILLIACINFMNLSTARSANRAKEVGIRKVLGAKRGIIMRQFFVEAMLLSLAAFLLAFGISLLLLGEFNELANKNLVFQDLLNPLFVGIMFLIMVFVGLMAGSYPAIYLSGFQPSQTLKGKLQLGMKSGHIRSALVVFQFTLSIMMIVGTGVVFDQLSFIQNKNLGFNKEQVLMVEDAWLLENQLQSFKQEIITDTRVQNGTISSYLPVNTSNNNSLFWKGKNPENESHVISCFIVDYDYIPTVGLELIQGRDLSSEYASDSSAMILNEAAVMKFGLENPIGATISTYGGSQEEPSVESYKVVGVVKDFHFENLKETIRPLIIYPGNSRGFASFRLSGDDIDGTIDMIREKWEDFAPGQPFSFSFLDQRFDKMYQAEQRFGKIFTSFAIFAILIASLGLFGLASFSAEQRSKEIGIRKVLGASISNIMGLLSLEFIKLVGISFIIAAPLSYFAMDRWLSNFAYRTNLSLITLILSGVLALLVAWVTMSFQTWRAARSNPVNSLRSE